MLYRSNIKEMKGLVNQVDFQIMSMACSIKGQKGKINKVRKNCEKQKISL